MDLRMFLFLYANHAARCAINGIFEMIKNSVYFMPTSSVIKIVDSIELNNRIRARPATRLLIADRQIYLMMSSIQVDVCTGFYCFF